MVISRIFKNVPFCEKSIFQERFRALPGFPGALEHQINVFAENLLKIKILEWLSTKNVRVSTQNLA